MHVWSVTGVRSDDTYSTFFICTNTGSDAALVAVEVFDPIGNSPLNNASDTSVEVFPDHTVTWATYGGAASQSQHMALQIAVSDARLASAARVLTTANTKAKAERIICAASVHVRGTLDGGFSLPVFRRQGQQGD